MPVSGFDHEILRKSCLGHQRPHYVRCGIALTKNNLWACQQNKKLKFWKYNCNQYTSLVRTISSRYCQEPRRYEFNFRLQLD